MINNNWLNGLKFELLLRNNFSVLSNNQWEKLLIEYCKSYHEKYFFDILEEPFVYLGIQSEKQDIDLTNDLSRIKSLVNEGIGEYCISLNEISSAISLLIDNKIVTKLLVTKVINHVLEAYSCNESPTDFLDREDNKLCKLFENYKELTIRSI